jgi:glutamine synthetase adenylyltransferase
VIDALGRTKLLAPSKAKTLRKNLLYLRSLETLVRINSEQSDFALPTDAARLMALRAGMGEKSVEELKRHIRTIQQTNRRLMLETFRKCHRA